MTIDKAIEILELENRHPWNQGNSDLRKAVKLGMAALVRIKTLRNENGAANYPLVGETGDETLPIKEGE